MTRKDELMQYLGEKNSIHEPLVDEILFLEQQLTALKKLPFIRVKAHDPEIQKSTPAQKQYKELLQQYINCVKALGTLANKELEVEESPLRIWAKERADVDYRA